jgi:hypothetical protein
MDTYVGRVFLAQQIKANVTLHGQIFVSMSLSHA